MTSSSRGVGQVRARSLDAPKRGAGASTPAASCDSRATSSVRPSSQIRVAAVRGCRSSASPRSGSRLPPGRLRCRPRQPQVLPAADAAPVRATNRGIEGVDRVEPFGTGRPNTTRRPADASTAHERVVLARERSEVGLRPPTEVRPEPARRPSALGRDALKLRNHVSRSRARRAGGVDIRSTLTRSSPTRVDLPSGHRSEVIVRSHCCSWS